MGTTWIVSTLLIVFLLFRYPYSTYGQCSQNSNCAQSEACLVVLNSNPTPDYTRDCVNTNHGDNCAAPVPPFFGLYSVHGFCITRDGAPSPCDGERCECSTTCQCASGYTKDAASDTCLRDLAFKEDCNELFVRCATTDSQCLPFMNTFICQCPSGFVYNYVAPFGECLQEVDGVGGSCTETVQCKVANAVCSGGTSCQCVSPYSVYDSTDKICREPRTFGQTCTINGQCGSDVTGAICDGFCTCPSTQVLDGMACKSSVAFGQACDDQVQCITETSSCLGVSPVCTCQSGFSRFTSGGADVCIEDVGFQDSCYQDSQCPTGLSCQNPGTFNVDRCLCEDDELWVSSSCVTSVAFGMSCGGEAIRCKTSGAVCSPTNCACPSMSVHVSDACYGERDYGFGCNNDDQCNDGSQTCSDTSDHCVCTSSNFFTDTLGCLPGVSFGNPCMDIGQCTTGQSVCNTNCVCLSGYVKNPSADICQEGSLGYEETCTFQGQCSFGDCQMRDDTLTKCRCDSDEVVALNLGSCLSLIDFNMARDQVSQCTTQCTDPSSSNCACRSGEVRDDGNPDQCLKTSVKFGYCGIDEQCTASDFECIDSMCVCKSGYSYSGTTQSCLEAIDFGDSTCTDAAVQCCYKRADCSSNMCDCESGYSYFTDGCYKSPQQYNDHCEIDDQCTVSDSNRECSSGRCKCVADYIFNFSGDECLEVIEYNGDPGSCTNPIQCSTTYAQCIGTAGMEKCLCPTDTIRYTSEGGDDICLKKANFHEYCEYEEQCQTTDATCTNNKCVCKTGFVFDADSGASEVPGACRTVRTETGNAQTCTAESQCQYQQSTCSTSCGCKSGTTFVTGVGCVCNGLDYEEACSYDDQCGVTSSSCSSRSRCDCPAGTVIDTALTECINQVDYNAECDQMSQCKTESAGCIDDGAGTDKCLCSSSQAHDANNDICLNWATSYSQACSIDGQCTGPSTASECSSGRCLCLATEIYVPNQGCFSILDFGESTCSFPQQCTTDGAVCSSSMCQCASTDVRCTSIDACRTKDLPLDTACDCDDQCKTTGATCRDFDGCKRCLCPSGHVYDTSADTCRDETSGMGACTISLQCDIIAAVCSSSTCGCDSGYVLDTDTCYLEREFHEACEVDAQCTHTDSDRECSADGEGTFRCQCTSGYRYDKDDDLCYVEAALSESCSSDVQCETESADCMSTCQCAAMTVHDSVDDICLPGNVAFNEACRTSGQCCTSLAQCLPDDNSNCRKCSCPSGLIHYHAPTATCGQCVARNLAYNNQTCVFPGQCATTGPVSCIGGLCLCPNAGLSLGNYYHEPVLDKCIYINYVNTWTSLSGSGPQYADPNHPQFEYMAVLYITPNSGNTVQLMLNVNINNAGLPLRFLKIDAIDVQGMTTNLITCYLAQCLSNYQIPQTSAETLRLIYYHKPAIFRPITFSWQEAMTTTTPPTGIQCGPNLVCTPPDTCFSFLGLFICFPPLGR